MVHDCEHAATDDTDRHVWSVPSGVTVALLHDAKTTIDVAVVMVVPIALGAFALQVMQSRHDSEPDLDVVAQGLARSVAEQREYFLRQVLGVSYTQEPAGVEYSAPAARELPLTAENLLMHWQTLRPSRHVDGSLDTIADFYLSGSVPHKRLVIMGAPGSGKSVLASRLTTALIGKATRSANDHSVTPVPVWLSLPGCDIDPANAPTRQRAALQDWLARQLASSYGVRGSLARRLLELGMVLPVLDGLDELDFDHAVAVLHGLNGRPQQPVIITTRHKEYGRLITGVDSDHETLVIRDATHIALCPMTESVIVNYIESTLTPRQWQKWADILSEIRSGGAVTNLLSRPLYLTFAILAYRDSNAPEDLLELSLNPDEAMTPLVGLAVPTLVRGSPIAKERNWDPNQVMHWLTSIAVHVHENAARTGPDIVLPDLWSLGARRGSNGPAWWRTLMPRLFAGLSVGMVCALALALVTCLAAGVMSGPMAGLAGGLVVGVVGWLLVGWIVFRGSRTTAPIKRVAGSITWKYLVLRVSNTSWSSRLTVLISSAMGVLTLASLNDEITPHSTGIAPAAAVWLPAIVSMSGLFLLFILGDEPDTVRLCRDLLRQGLKYSLMTGLITGLTLVVAFSTMFLPSILTGRRSGNLVDYRDASILILAYGLIIGIVCGMTIGRGWVWLRYFIGTRVAIRAGDLPRDVSGFLDWGLDVGLFRMSGYSLQFRHHRLYTALLNLSTDRAYTERLQGRR